MGKGAFGRLRKVEVGGEEVHLGANARRTTKFHFNMFIAQKYTFQLKVEYAVKENPQ